MGTSARQLLTVPQPPLTLGKRSVIGKAPSPQRLDEEKSQGSTTTFDRAGREFAVAKQMTLLLADMLWAEAVR